MPSVEFTSNALYMSVPIGIGITNPQYPLHIGFRADQYNSYSSITYEDYTQWDAYTSRIDITNIVFDTDDGYVKLPDFGFDFILNAKNQRNSSYVGTNSYITFGSGMSYYLNHNTRGIVGLHIGSDDSRVLSVNGISYYAGTYNNAQAFYVFYDGYDYGDPSRLYKWCVVFQSNNNIRIFMKSIVNNNSALFGIGLGDGTWYMQLPEHNTIPNFTNRAYVIDITRTSQSFIDLQALTVQGSTMINGSITVSMNVGIGTLWETNNNTALLSGGNIICTSNVGIGTSTPAFALQVAGDVNIGLGVYSVYPPIGLTSNVYTIKEAPYGKGTYIATASSYPYGQDPVYAFDQDTSVFSQGTDNLYNNTTGAYQGTVITSFTDFSNNADSIMGEWLQLQMPQSILLSKYGLVVSGLYPKKFVLLGSNDGNTWKLVDDHRVSEVTYSVSPNETEIMVYPTQAFKYYRLVTSFTNTSVNQFGGINPSYVSIQSLNFYVKNKTQVRIDGNTYIQGNVGIGTTTPATALVVNGTIRNINAPAPTSGTSLVITGDGDIAPQSSDARYKTNVQDLPPVLDSIMNLRAVSYNWKEETSPKWYGLLAQQVSDVFPDAAWHNLENDTYGVHYTPTVVTLLLKAVQELKDLDAQKTLQIQELTTLVQDLSSRFA